MTQLDIPAAIKAIERQGFDAWFQQELVKAFYSARQNKLKTHDEHHFELHWMENLVRLQRTIEEYAYEPSPSVSFVIFDPMVREIFAAPFIDRVVHHFLYNMQYGWWDRRFIYDSYSCREGKGTLFGVQRAQKLMQRGTNNYHDPAYIVKLDIRGYFMSLPRAKIYARVKWGLDRQFAGFLNNPHAFRLYKTCDYLWRQTLMDDPIKKARKRGPLTNWSPDILPPAKSLYTQPPGYGIVIGNLTSQLVSNIYLDQLDRFITMKLGYKYYGRYVDDFFFIVKKSDLPQAKQDVKRIELYLRDELHLTLHPKKRYIQPVEHGMQFLGARIYPHALCPSDRLKTHFNAASDLVASGQKKLDTVISYLGIMKHLDADKYLKHLFDSRGWDYRPSDWKHR